jgi:sulfur carrier protein
MTVLVNGESREVHRATDVAALVSEFGLPAPTLLIEHNGIALTRSEWPQTPLAQGDRLELLRVTAGG